MAAVTEFPLWLENNKHELVHWDIDGLPFMFFHHVLSPSTYDALGWAWHEELQITYVISGSIKLSMQNSAHIVKEGSAALTFPSHLHRIDKETTSTEIVTIMIATSFPYPFSGTSMWHKYVLPLKDYRAHKLLVFDERHPENKALLQAVKGVVNTFLYKPEYWELKIHAQMLSVWEMLLCRIPRQSSTVKPQTAAEAPPQKRLQKIIAYVRTHYAEDLTLQEIADKVFLSRNECCRFFRKEAGVSLFDFILQYRVFKSAELLMQTRDSISKIADETGFHSSTYYARCFRKYFGMSPSDYRKSRGSASPVFNDPSQSIRTPGER